MLTSAEKEIVVLLGEVWNAFLKLPSEHPDDNSEFRTVIHTAQRQVLARSGRRYLNDQ